jgi:hypothetical protein
MWLDASGGASENSDWGCGCCSGCVTLTGGGYSTGSGWLCQRECVCLSICLSPYVAGVSIAVPTRQWLRLWLCDSVVLRRWQWVAVSECVCVDLCSRVCGWGEQSSACEAMAEATATMDVW